MASGLFTSSMEASARHSILQTIQKQASSGSTGIWDDKAKQPYTSSLGSIERGEDHRLYLTINDNPKEPMYLATKRIPLTFIEDREEIQRSDVEKMQSRMQSVKPR